MLGHTIVFQTPLSFCHTFANFIVEYSLAFVKAAAFIVFQSEEMIVSLGLHDLIEQRTLVGDHQELNLIRPVTYHHCVALCVN